jgi:hypothetical protein
MAVSASQDQAVEQESIATSTTLAKEADFRSLCIGVTLHCTEDANIAFDRGAQAGDFLLKADTMINIPDIKFTRISALATSTGGTLYILAQR